MRKLHERLGLDPSHRAPAEAIGARASGVQASGPTAISALAIGATAIGALAIGRLAIGKLTAGRVHFERLRVDELEVGSLTIEDPDPGLGLSPAGSAALAGGPARIATGTSKLSHVDLVVSSLDASLPFYSGMLEPLGWSGRDEIVGERGETIHYISAPGTGVAAIGLREKQSDAHPAPYDRYALGVHHVCIDVPSRAVVDERAEWADGQDGAEVLSGPAEYDYTPGYYAVFLADPDGIKIELLHRPGYWGAPTDGGGGAA